MCVFFGDERVAACFFQPRHKTKKQRASASRADTHHPPLHCRHTRTGRHIVSSSPCGLNCPYRAPSRPSGKPTHPLHPTAAFPMDAAAVPSDAEFESYYAKVRLQKLVSPIEHDGGGGDGATRGK